MKKTILTAIAASALIIGGVTPAHAAGFAAKESWTRGSEGIEKFVDSASCDFMKSHAHLMRIKVGESYSVNKNFLMKDKFVRDYMSNRVNQGAGSHAKMVPANVRTKLIDLGIAATIKRAAYCKLIPNAEAEANADFMKIKDQGDKEFGSIDPIGVIAELPSLSSSNALSS